MFQHGSLSKLMVSPVYYMKVAVSRCVPAWFSLKINGQSGVLYESGGLQVCSSMVLSQN